MRLNFVVGFLGVIALTACAPLARPAFIEVELTGFPENPQAVKLGPIKALVQDKFKGNSDLRFELGGQTFTGQMQVIDESVTTSGRTASTSQAQSVGVSNPGVAAGAAAAQRQSASVSTTRQASSKGQANAMSEKGMTMVCEYIVNNAQHTGTGSCEVSNGAKYRFYAKPVRLVMSDGSSKPM